MSGRFLVLEGIDGCGKSTQIEALHAWLPASGLMAPGARLVVTREPGGTALGQALRSLLLRPPEAAAPCSLSELMLYAADRAQHVEKCLRPALAAGDWVLCDRFSGSTAAYQGYGRGLPLPTILQLEALATGGLAPDLTLWLDLPLAGSLRRRGDRPADRIEAAGEAFLQRVSDGFATLAGQRGWQRVAAGGPIEEVTELCRALIREHLGAPGGMAMAELFADLVGQPQAVGLLTAALDRQRLAPAYLFVGADGVGRRLAALRLLEGVLAGGTAGSVPLRRRLAEGNHPDLLWVEPTYLHQGRLVKASEAEVQGISRRSPPQLRLEQVREVTRFLARRPVEGGRSLVVLETAEAMAEAAANALLKTLEEPGHGLLILLTATPDRLLSTIRSRCQTIPFARLPPALVREVLERLPLADGEPQAPMADPPELLELAAGSPGALLRHRRVWQGLPEGLAERLLALGREPMEALGLARDLSEALDGEQQLWLLDWWQLHLWRQRLEPAPLRRLEQLRSHLLAYVQPRLAWEVALLDLGR